MKKVSVIGAGSWGTALANVLADNGYEVWMWSLNQNVVTSINENHVNSKYLTTCLLHTSIYASSNIQEVMKDSKMCLFVVPSHVTREVAKQVAPYITPNMNVLHASKGLENDTFKRISDIISDELSSSCTQPVCVLSGPSHAEETIKRLPTTVSIASTDQNQAKVLQKMFANEYFRVYTNEDIVGVELGGALKNIVAVGAGLSDGLGFGDNAKAALLTRGIAEITRLGVALGAKESTFLGLSGIGDLIVTGNSQHSRNWKTGKLLAEGKPLHDVLNELGMVAEGVKTTKVAHTLAQKMNIDMPITAELYRILFEDKDPKSASLDLMNRHHKSEQ